MNADGIILQYNPMTINVYAIRNKNPTEIVPKKMQVSRMTLMTLNQWMAAVWRLSCG